MPKLPPVEKKPPVATPMGTVDKLPEFGAENGLQIVSYSEMSTFRDCPLKHLLGYKERWKKPVLVGSPLSRGSLWHQVMEVHYGVIMENYPKNNGPIGKARIPEVLAEAKKRVWIYLYDQVTGKQDEDQRKVQWMYEGYVDMWGVDNDWKFIAIEYPFEVQLKNALGELVPYVLKGKIDILAQSRINGGFWIWDHKSGAALPTSMNLEIDDQFGGYTWAMGELGYEVRGSLHNAAKTTMNKGDEPGAILNGNVKKQTLEQRFSRTPLNRTKQETINVAADFAAAAMNAYPPPEYPQLPIYSSPDPRNCGWKCDFKEVHLLARGGRDIHEVLKEYRFRQDFTRH